MKLTGIILGSLIFSQGAWCEPISGAPLFLEVGEQRSLSFPFLLRYSMSGSQSVHYTRPGDGNSILIKALKPGLSVLYVLNSNDRSETHVIRVSALKKRIYPETFLEALNYVKSSEVIDAGTRYILRGMITTSEEAQAIATLKQYYPEFIEDETTRLPSDLERQSERLKKLLLKYPNVKLEINSGNLSLSGGFATPSAKESFQKVARAIDPLVELNLRSLKDADPTLYFKVFLLEVKKELITSLGIEWPPEQQASLNLGTKPFFSMDSIDLTLHALSQKGLVRDLSSPELVVKAPGQAELFAGGELPIRERSRFSDNILWKSIGLSLKLDVKEYGGEKVRLTIETEMSHLDGDLTNDHIPGVQTNRIKTLVDGVIGKPLLLSGLLQEDLRDSSAGIPGLSNIPVLGALFSSEDYRNHRSEFVAILLPERNLPNHPMTRISGAYPRGYLPIPRNYLSEEEKEKLKASPTYPWNAL